MSLIVAFSGPIVNGYQANPKLSVQTDQRAYIGNGTVVVSGAITQVMGDDISIVIMNPSGAPIASKDVTTDEFNGMYQTEFSTGGPAWTESGTYEIVATWQFCPETVSNSTDFSYTTVADSKNQTLASAYVSTVTPCYTSRSTTQTSNSLGLAENTARERLLDDSIRLPVVAISMILLFTLIVGWAVMRKSRGSE